MGRRKGAPAYKNKSVGPKTIITTREAWRKIKQGQRESDKSVSDIITYYVITGPDITKNTFAKIVAAETH